jgi:hypothetical protein
MFKGLTSWEYLGTLGNMEKESNLVTLVVGDSSTDGHDKRHYYTVRTNFDKDSMNKAYRVGCNILGCNFCDVFYTGYDGGPTLTKDVGDKLIDLGVITKRDLYNDYVTREYEYYLYDGSETFAKIYLGLVKLGNKEFEYEFVRLPKIDIGGYGLV